MSMRNLIEIAKRAKMNLSNVSSRGFCRQQ